jgi:hypothetical protein
MLSEDQRLLWAARGALVEFSKRGPVAVPSEAGRIGRPTLER